MFEAILVMSVGAIVLGAALGYAAVKFRVEGDPLVEKLMQYCRKHNAVNVAFRAANPMHRRLRAARRKSINARPVARTGYVSLPICLAASSNHFRPNMALKSQRLLPLLTNKPVLAAHFAFKLVQSMQ